MAAFNLYLGEPRGYALLHRKHRDQPPEGELGLDSSSIHALGVDIDPYSTQVWIGSSLDDLLGQLTAKMERMKQTIVDGVLQKTGKGKLEDWMNPMLLEAQEKNEELKIVTRLSELVSTAKKKNGTLIYWGD